MTTMKMVRFPPSRSDHWPTATVAAAPSTK